MGPGSWTRLISSTPPLKGTAERLPLPPQSQPGHDALGTYPHKLDAKCHLRLNATPSPGLIERRKNKKPPKNVGSSVRELSGR